MAHIKTKKTKRGLTYHIVDKSIGKTKKIPARTRKEAEMYLKKYEGDRADNRPNALMAEDVGFDEFVSRYLLISRSRKNESTYRKDLSHLKPLLDKWGRYRLKSITLLDIQQAQAEWLDEGLSKKTVNNRSNLLSAILRQAYKLHLISNMPEIPKLKIDKRPPQWYTEEQIDLILSNVRPFVRDFVIVLLYSGLRQGELQRLKWQHIDFRNRKLVVELAKSHKFRAVPMNDTLYSHLKDVRSRSKANQVYVFENADGSPYNDYYHALKKELKRLGIEGTLHQLRHTFASKLVQNGVSIYEVQHLLGHASVQTTQVYAHIRNEDLSRAVNRICNAHVITGRTKGEPGKILHLKLA